MKQFSLFAVGLATPAAAQDARAAKGAQVYADQKCALCHSIGDKGNNDAKGMTAKAKAPRTPAMKNYDLPKDDLDALVAYMATLKKK